MFAANRFKSGGLSPDRLPGLAAWYSADYGVLTSVGPDVAATDGQPVRRWLDRSGNGRHLDQTTLAKQPAFTTTGGANGSPFLLFDGLAGTMATANFTLNQPYTQVLVLRRVAGINGRICDGTAGGLDSGAIRMTGNTTVGLRAGSPVNVNMLTQGEDEVMAVVWNGASTLFYAATKGVQTASPGTTSPGGITLAAQAVGSASWSNIRAFELIYYQGEVIPTQLNRYLKRRYGFDLT